MSRRLALSLLLLLVLSSPAPAFVERSEAVTFDLPGGMPVTVREEPALSVAELQVWVKVGGRDEPQGKEGIAHLFEHMLFKGTARRRVGEIAAAIEGAGGEINAWTSVEQTVYHVTIGAADWETALDVLADAVQHSSFDPAELEKEKQVVVEEIRQGRDQPARVFRERLFAAAFTRHPYGRTVIGTPESVASVTRGDMLAFHRRHYLPGNMRLMVVGPVSPARVRERAEKLFPAPSSPAAPPRREKVEEPPPAGLRVVRMTADTDPARITLAFPGVAFTDPRAPVQDLLSALLSGGASARLPRLVVDKALALDAWSGAWTPADPGLFLAGASCGQGGVETALGALLRELRSLREVPVGKEELERARGQMLAGKILSRQKAEGQAEEMGSLSLLTGDPTWGERYYARLQAVDAADLLAEARALFREDRLTAAFLTRAEKDQPTENRLQTLLKEALPVSRSPRLPVGDEVHTRRLPNGVTLLAREDHRLPLVAVKAGVLGGVRFEDAATSGSGNLLARLLTRGTAKRSAEELARRLDELSAGLSGFSGRNSMGVGGGFFSRDLAEALALAAECLLTPSLPEEELALARDQVRSEIRARRDRLASTNLDLLAATLYREHPYRFPVGGTEETVGAATRDRLLALHRRVVRPEALVVSLCGDFDPAEALAEAERVFGALPAAPAPVLQLPREKPLEGVREAREKRPGKEQTHLALGFFGPTLTSPDRAAVDVLNAILAGQGGRLFTELRDRRSLAYSVWSAPMPGVEPGSFVFSIATSPSREKEALAAFREQIRLVREEEVPPGELDRARAYLAGGYAIGLQTVAEKADQLFFAALYGEKLEEALAYPERVRAVTAAAVREAARRYLDPDRYVLAVTEGGAP